MKPILAVVLLVLALSVCELSNKSSDGDSSSSDTADDSAIECNESDAEDQDWCNRLKLKRMGSQPSHTPVAEVPSDPNTDRIYNHPIIFSSSQLYIWMSSVTYKLEGYGDQYRNSQKFFFLPTGRFFYKSTTYQGQTSPDGNVVTYWGRYRFTKSDEMEIETDEGEKHTFPVKHGRRNLVWDETTYDQVDWANESLQRYLNQ